MSWRWKRVSEAKVVERKARLLGRRSCLQTRAKYGNFRVGTSLREIVPQAISCCLDLFAPQILAILLPLTEAAV